MSKTIEPVIVRYAHRTAFQKVEEVRKNRMPASAPQSMALPDTVLEGLVRCV